MDTVDASKVGIYATSESTWISSYLLQRDPDVAFQVLLSPMVYEPRYSLGFLAAQDFALVGAHDATSRSSAAYSISTRPCSDSPTSTSTR